eukprot:Pgem_evm1s7519
MVYDVGFDFGFGMSNSPIASLVGGFYDDAGLTNPNCSKEHEQGRTDFYKEGIGVVMFGAVS